MFSHLLVARRSREVQLKRRLTGRKHRHQVRRMPVNDGRFGRDERTLFLLGSDLRNAGDPWHLCPCFKVRSVGDADIEDGLLAVIANDHVPILRLPIGSDRSLIGGRDHLGTRDSLHDEQPGLVRELIPPRKLRCFPFPADNPQVAECGENAVGCQVKGTTSGLVLPRAWDHLFAIDGTT